MAPALKRVSCKYPVIISSVRTKLVVTAMGSSEQMIFLSLMYDLVCNLETLVRLTGLNNDPIGAENASNI